MSKFEIKLNSDGVKDLLKSDAISAECMRYAQNAANDLGDGFMASARNYQERSGAAVVAYSNSARRKSLDDSNMIIDAVLRST